MVICSDIRDCNWMTLSAEYSEDDLKKASWYFVNPPFTAASITPKNDLNLVIFQNGGGGQGLGFKNLKML